jgi:hypothetical protein
MVALIPDSGGVPTRLSCPSVGNLQGPFHVSSQLPLSCPRRAALGLPAAYQAAIRRGRNLTVVDHVQSGIALLLLCLNLSDVRLQCMLPCFERGSGTFPQMCELLPRLFDRQDAPDGATVTLPFLWIVMCGHGMRVVTLATVVRSPFLHAVPVVSHGFRRG